MVTGLAFSDFFFPLKIDGTSIQHLDDGLICVHVCIASGVG